jgi:hypothetical protein
MGERETKIRGGDDDDDEEEVNDVDNEVATDVDSSLS